MDESEIRGRDRTSGEASIWRKVPGLIKYEVTECGRVRRLGLKSDRELRPFQLRVGYPAVTVRPQVNVKKNVTLHRIVAIAWVPGYFAGAWVNHIDGNKLNCHASNLEWVTPKGNSEHARATGLRRDSKSNHTIAQYEEMIRLRALGMSFDNIALAVGASPSSVKHWIGGRRKMENLLYG